jgi:hypothetical protein
MARHVVPARWKSGMIEVGARLQTPGALIRLAQAQALQGATGEALTTLENARMEWNSARLKFPLLSGKSSEADATTTASNPFTPSALAGLGFGQLCRMGLALTWPLAVVALAALGVFLGVLLRR